MAGFRATGNNGCFTDTYFNPGDVLLGGESVTSIGRTTGGFLAASQLLTGVIFRSGATGAITDTFDSAVNIFTALSSGANSSVPEVIAGSTFRVRLINTGAGTETINLGPGEIAGVGAFTLATNTWRDFLFTFTNATVPQSCVGVTVNGSSAVSFVSPNGVVGQALPLGPNPYGIDVMPGAAVTGTGIPSGTTVASLTYGQGGVTGCILSANATTNGTTALSFGPQIQIDSIGAGTAP